MPIQKPPETGALQAMATWQCQKSGNGFPPDAAFLPPPHPFQNTAAPVGTGLLAIAVVRES
jgi:hypothetical protein